MGEESSIKLAGFEPNDDRNVGSAERRLLGLAQRIYDARRKRDATLPKRIFSEPSWDILLDLFIAASSGHPVKLSSVCVACALPAVSAMRWLNVLHHEGLIECLEDEDAGQISHVKLSDSGLQLMRDLLSQIQ